MGGLFTKLFEKLYSKKLEAVVLGLENAGKTTLLNVISSGQPLETCPTIGLDVKMMKKGGVSIKAWDLGGQKQFREDWPRYAEGCDVIIFVVDSHAYERLSSARRELHRLLENSKLSSIPLLVCSNKVDLHPHVSEAELIRELNLDYVTENPWLVIPMSALKQTNIDQVLNWLIKAGKS
eukprot:TRINITY_DN778093_c0_g1_i1.p1 TRINITY_DN778093_c0_g1~~TRINITY_DN778093_c0_g1_i1.p1  ORF type:complete len:179 (+),score=35.90 TRINITY_DN778093_c0_g1_i1:54-590(+)